MTIRDMATIPEGSILIAVIGNQAITIRPYPPGWAVFVESRLLIQTGKLIEAEEAAYGIASILTRLGIREG